MSLETNSGTIFTQSPLQHTEGRSQLTTIYSNDTQDRLKQAIKDIYTDQIVEFIKTGQNPEGCTYDFTTHNWRAMTNEDGDAKTDINMASRDFLAQRVNQLAKSFVEGTDCSEKLVKDFLLYKLGVDKFKSTEDFIENGQTHIGADHKKLNALLTKIHEGSFKEKATRSLSLSQGSSEQSLEELSAFSGANINDQDTPTADDEYNSSASEGSPEIAPFTTAPSDEENVEENSLPIQEPERSVDELQNTSSVKTPKVIESDTIDSKETVTPSNLTNSLSLSQGSSEQSLEELSAFSGANINDQDTPTTDDEYNNSASEGSPGITPFTAESSDEENVEENSLLTQEPKSSVDELQNTSSVEEIDSVDKQPKAEESEQPKKSRSAIARFFARIGNGIEKFSISILNFFKNLFSKK